jgi:hypothetical protein
LRKQTKSILEEISGIVPNKDPRLVLESRANHIINSAINLISQMRENYPPEAADELERRFINSIKGQDPNKFFRGLKKYSKKD